MPHALTHPFTPNPTHPAPPHPSPTTTPVLQPDDVTDAWDEGLEIHCKDFRKYRFAHPQQNHSYAFFFSKKRTYDFSPFDLSRAVARSIVTIPGATRRTYRCACVSFVCNICVHSFTSNMPGYP